jgi:hypothetical protein
LERAVDVVSTPPATIEPPKRLSEEFRRVEY